MVEDALSSNAPHLDDLRAADLRFIIGVKPGSHAFLFAQMQTASDAGRTCVLNLQDAGGVQHHYRWLEKASLNESNADVLVTMIDYQETHPNGTIRHFSWITDLPVDSETVPTIARGGRARWHIENETFNTLKNQGYQFDHNFGHGYKNLSVVFAFLMMLAFLVDQTQQLCCPLFQAAWEKLKTKRRLWEVIRHLFHTFLFNSLRIAGSHRARLQANGADHERHLVAISHLTHEFSDFQKTLARCRVRGALLISPIASAMHLIPAHESNFQMIFHR